MLPEEIVRCPYCVAGGTFRPMLQPSKGWFLCLGCSHTAKPADPSAKCNCPRCQQMKQLASRCKSGSEPQRYAPVEARIPGQSATVFVALALTDGMPMKRSVGNERKLPPPAIAFSAPAAMATPNSRAIREAIT